LSAPRRRSRIRGRWRGAWRAHDDRWRARTGHGAGTYIGDRWADQANLSCLPSYKTLDLGALASIGANWEVPVAATNLTNELGLTEGNSRLTGAQSSGPINARPIFGRAVEASLLYRF
jgi:iron complex outermembrane receptor protein